MNYLGIDNGVSGTLGIVTSDAQQSIFIPQFVFKTQDYTKKVKQIHRIHVELLTHWLRSQTEPMRAFIERPMVNPMRFVATGSALRALEATLIVLESCAISYQFVDSKEWQRVMLPQGIKGDALKCASKDIGIRLFPQHKDVILGHGDADGLLIAEWARRNQR